MYPPLTWRRRLALILGALLLSANGLAALSGNLYFSATAIWLVALAVPGCALGTILFGAEEGERSGIEAVLYLCGLGYGVALLGTLLIHYWPGPISRRGIYVAFDALSAGPLAWLWFAKADSPAPVITWPKQRALLALVALLVLMGALRFVNLGYSEFQGDEVAVLHKAAAAIQGRDDALFFHKKGPVEILMTLLTYAGAWRMNELIARLPFALASLLGILAVYQVARRAWNARAAWLAGLLVGLIGFLVAFGRIVQYQSFVFLFSALGILAAWRYRASGDRRHLWLTALFLALGLLSHTDAAFALPVAALLIVEGYVRDRVPLREAWAHLWGPALLALALLALFYVPFVRHPHFAEAQGYIQARTGLPPYSNFGHLFDIGSVYNCVYYLAFLALGLLAVALYALRGRGRRRWLWPAALLVLLAASWLRPESWQVGERDYVGLLYAAGLLAAGLSGDSCPFWRGALVWFALPFVTYLFLFQDPRTHLYVFFPGACLLVAHGLDRLASQGEGPRWLSYALIGCVALLSLGYLTITFVSHSPEYQRTYPDHRLALFWTPYGDEMPEQGLFGFPYRAGWKAIGYLYRTGVLQGDYATNEETHVTRWYTRGASPCMDRPRYFFIAKDVQDVQEVPQKVIDEEYRHTGTVLVGDEPKLWIYERLPVEREGIDTYSVGELAAGYDQSFTAPDYPTRLEYVDRMYAIAQPTYYQLGNEFEFLGYTLHDERARPGGEVMVTLYWRGTQPIDRSYTVFMHVEDSGMLWGQKDGLPDCGRQPTEEWVPDEVQRDRRVAVLRPDTPAGPHNLVVGLYLRETGERLPVRDAEGNPLGDSITLCSIIVE